MPSKRVKYAMAHLSHKQHISLLARPNWRRIQTTDMNILPDPFTTSRAALRSRASKRIKIMARPKYVNRKYDPSIPTQLYQRIHPKTLKARATKRILDLAIPKKRLLVATMRFAAINLKIKENVLEQLEKEKGSRYRKYRIFCNAVLERDLRSRRKEVGKARRSLRRAEDWEKHIQALQKLAEPKKIHKPKRVKKKKWRPVNMKRVKRLAEPVSREEPFGRDPFTVEPKALTYNASRRIKSLAVRKRPPKLHLPRIPGKVTEAAKKAVVLWTNSQSYLLFAPSMIALIGCLSPHFSNLKNGITHVARASERTLILAKAAYRPPGVETDLKEDAFTVSPTALKAKCSRRLKLLAKPKTYVKVYAK